MNQNRVYFDKLGHVGRLMNRWDWLLLFLVVAILFFLGWTSQQMAKPYAVGEPLFISLAPGNLPGYALRTILRLFVALLLSIVFSLIVGTIAAKNRRAEQIIIPAIDILQSVPVLSFLAITVVGFIRLFPGSLLGPECASIFAVFVSQVWNITFSFYQSLKTVPNDLKEMAAVFQLSSWQYFWKVEVPCAMSGLLWNMMISMSASWFFVVLSEAIVVGHQDIRLPGIGSYIALAIEQHNIQSLIYAIVTMLIVIFLYDQILSGRAGKAKNKTSLGSGRVDHHFLGIGDRRILLKFLHLYGFGYIRNWACVVIGGDHRRQSDLIDCVKLINLDPNWGLDWAASSSSAKIAAHYSICGSVSC